MTKMIHVSLDTEAINKNEAQEWVSEIANIYADMEVSDIKTTTNSISFKAGLSGMDDTTPDDIEQKINEYLTMNEAFTVKNIFCS